MSHTVSVHGHTYRTGSVLPLKIECKGEPVFGEIIHIIQQADNVGFFVRILKVKYFDDHFYAFVVEQTKEYQMISLISAADARPLDIMLSFSTDELYVNPRYKII